MVTHARPCGYGGSAPPNPNLAQRATSVAEEISIEMTTLNKRKTPALTGSMKRMARMPSAVRWTLYIFLFSLCFENYDPFNMSGSVTLSKMAGILFALACFWKAPGIFVRQHWTVLLLLWVWLWLAIVTFVAELEFPVSETAFRNVLFAQAQCFLLYWLSVNVLRDRRTAAYGLLAFTASAALMCVLMKLGIGRQVYREGMFHERISFLGANSNIIAVWSGISLLVIVGIVVGNVMRWDYRRYGLLLLVAPMLVVMIESGSRGAAVSLVLAMACFLLTAGSLDKRILIGLASVCICLGFYYLSKGSVLADRFQKTAETGSMAGREELWPAAIRMIGKRPLFGWGMYSATSDELAPVIPRGDLEGNDPHNAFLAFFVFGGAFAGVAFVTLNLYWLYRTFTARNRRWGILPFAMTVFIVSTMFKGGGFYIAKIPWVILAFSTASCIPRRQQELIRLRRPKRRASASPTDAPEATDVSGVPSDPSADRRAFSGHTV
ncbi:MAG: O-antigen ligase family protein [Verrucomicrobiota bacterium]